MSRTPGVVVVFPRIRGRFDRGELIRAVVTGNRPADTREIWVDWGRVLVALMDIATGGIGLPDLDELTTHRTTIAVHDLTANLDAFTNGFTIVLDGQIRFQNVHVAMTKSWRVQLNGFRVGVV